MDDEAAIRDVVRDMLESMGYVVVCTTNGIEAVDFFASELRAKRKLATMIFDLTVPGSTGGKAAILEIRKLNKDIPAFVASGYAEDPVMMNPVAYGFTASIRKPFRMTDLSDMLSKHLKPENWNKA
jgi:CheY-like chemotaxis protein